ncbi:MAG: DUF3078 domain-containing protein [bacterium]|nr:DUF3078 domain-containing protein [bacterium]
MKYFKLSLTIILFLILTGVSVLAQPAQNDTTASDVNWVKSLRLRLQFNQIFFENWTKGGENTFNWLLNVDNTFTRSGNNIKWDTISRLRYGQSKVGEGITKITDNELDMRSDVVFEQRKHVNIFLGASLKTQVTTGYIYNGNEKDARSDFIDPMYLTQKLGLDFNFIPELKLRLSLDLGEKIADSYAAFHGVDDPATEKIEKLKVTKGLGLWSQYKRQFKDKVNLDTVMDFTYDLERISHTILDWRTAIDFKLIKSISLSVDAIYRYDKTQSKQGQLKQTTGISVIYDLLGND